MQLDLLHFVGLVSELFRRLGKTVKHDVDALIRRIDLTIELAEKAETECGRYAESFRRIAGVPDDGQLDAEHRLTQYTREIYSDIRVLSEALELMQVRAEIVQAERQCGAATALKQESEAPVFSSPALREAKRFLGSLKALSSGNAIRALDVFHSILDQTGKLIRDLKLVPANEAEVRNIVLRTIRYGFSDARKEEVMPNNITNFRMDISIPSLNAAAEYKFVDSAKALQSCLGGIYEDMTAYNGNAEWKHFFAVIYMTSPFRTQREIELEFKKVGARSNWVPVIVVGPGERKRKDASDRDS